MVRWQDRWQRDVSLSDPNWRDKILLDHAELIDDRASIERTLIDPDQVRLDRDHGDREGFYRREVVPPPNHRDDRKVVAACRSSASGRQSGRVVTADATDTIKPRERLKWKR